jgi:hypothetical protein
VSDASARGVPPQTRDVCANGGCGGGQGVGLREPVLRVLAGLKHLGLALCSASAVVEEHMQPVSAALDVRLGKLDGRITCVVLLVLLIFLSPNHSTIPPP